MILESGMGRFTIAVGFLSAIIPIILIFFDFIFRNRFGIYKLFRRVFLFIFFIIICYLTLNRDQKQTQQINLMPLWSYEKFYRADIRWQIYMNIFLFIPFGFMLPWATGRTLLQTILIGCLLSIIIEASQYIFCIGMCETDDVIHNTLGTIIGFGYWRLLQLITERLKNYLHKHDKPTI